VLRFHERRSLIYSASRQDEMKPKLAAFPKCYMDELCVRRTISGSCSLEETPDVMERLARGELKAFKMIIRGHLE
jgi:hypothetical protein